METVKQILFRRIHQHRDSCALCISGTGTHFECEFVNALLKVYHGCEIQSASNPILEARLLDWNVLALASLQADDDSDVEWVIAMDTIIAQRVEFMWAVSETHWSKSVYDRAIPY